MKKKAALVTALVVILVVIAGCTLPLINDQSATDKNPVDSVYHFTPFIVPDYLKVTPPPRIEPKTTIPTQTLTYKDVILPAIQREFGTWGYELMVTDTKWRAYTWHQIAGFLLYQDDTNKIPYQDNYFDCDDYAKVTLGDIAKALPGVAFGILFFQVRGSETYHAVNFFYMPDFYQRIICFEPQGDGFFWFDLRIYKPYWIYI